LKGTPEKSFTPVFQSGSKYWFKTLFYTQTSGVEPVCRTSFSLCLGLKTIEKPVLPRKPSTRADLQVPQYNGLMDNVHYRAERENAAVGSVYILPSSFIGSPRAMKQAYQDAMAICGKHGKPTFFLTFTCNLKWQEIT
jgi:hypothetical protein